MPTDAVSLLACAGYVDRPDRGLPPLSTTSAERSVTSRSRSSAASTRARVATDGVSLQRGFNNATAFRTTPPVMTGRDCPACADGSD